MKSPFISQAVLTAILAVAFMGSVCAQDTTGVAASALESNPPEKLNKVSLGYRMGLNITVDFKGLGGFPALSDPGPATGSTFNRNYDNGSYNRVDISGNNGGTTWYWGYESASQLQGNALVMESSSSPNNIVSKNNQNDPQHGLEASYSRQLYRHDNLRFGIEAAFGYTLIDASDSRALFARVDRIIDTFTFPGGVNVVPAAPYHGTFEGPGALLSSSPERNTTVVSRDALIVGLRKIDSDVFTFRLGPYMEVPVYKNLSAILSGGLTLAVADTHFSYRETVTLLDTGEISGPRSSSASQTDFLVGGYVAGSLSYAFAKEFSLFAGLQFQTAGKSVTESPTLHHQAVTHKEAVLDLGQSVLLVFGATYSF